MDITKEKLQIYNRVTVDENDNYLEIKNIEECHK